MTETSRKANLEFGVQNNTKSGLEEIKRDIQVIGREAEKSGDQARSAFDGMGKSSEEAAAKFTRSEARMVSGLRSTVEQMEVALRQSKGLADAFQFKAEFRGFDAAKFDPMLARVRELESQLSLVKAAEAEWAAQNAFAKKHLQATELAKASQYASWWSAELNKVEAAERKLASETAFIKSLKSQSDAIGKTRADLLELQAAQMGISAQAAPYIANLRDAEKGMQGVGMSAKAMDAAMRGVPAQFTDIIVSLQGGQAPLTVFLQQGGQLKDMFGGAGNAAKALSSYVLSLVTPVSLVAAGVVALGAAYYQGSQEQDAFVKAIVLTGNASGMTTSQLHEYARQIDAVVGTQAQAAAGLAAFTAAGVRGGEELQRYTQTAIEWERATGQSVEKTADQFASLQKDPLGAVLKLNEGTNFLTTSVYEQIKALDEQGNKTAAAEVAMNALDAAMSERAKAVESSLGYIERAWKGIKGAAAEAWDSMLNVGRPSTLRDEIASVQAEIDKRMTEPLAVDNDAMRVSREKAIANFQRQLTLLQDKLAQEELVAAAQAESARQTQARIEVDKKYAKQLEGEISLKQKLAVARKELESAGKSEADIKKVLAAITEEYNKKGASAAKAYNKELSDQQKLIGELSGLSSTFYKDWDKLSASYKRGGMSLAELEREQAKLLAKQPFAIALAKEEIKATEARVKAYEEEVKAQEKLLKQRQDAAQKAQDAVQKAREEEEAYALAASAGITLAEAVAQIAFSRAEENYQKGLAQSLDAETLLALQNERDARRELVEVMAQKGVREANKKAQDQITKDWEKLSETVGSTLADYIMGGGKDAAQYLKRLFATLVLQPVVQYGVSGAMSMLGMGGGPAAGGMAGAGNLLSMGQSAYSAFNSPMLSNFGMGLGMNINGFGTKMFEMGMESVGESLMDFGISVAEYADVINLAGDVLGYGKALYSLSQGKYGSAIGTGVGQWFGGPIGAAVGSMIGGVLDSAFSSRGNNHSGAAYSSSSIDNTAAARSLYDLTGGYGNDDLIKRRNADVEQQLKLTVDGLIGVYEGLAGYAGKEVRKLDLTAGFAVNGKHSDEDAYAYFKLIDQATGEVLQRYTKRDGGLGSDPAVAYTKFTADMAGALIGEIKKTDIPGWMRGEFDKLGDDITLDGLNQALLAVSAIDTAFKAWSDTLVGFKDLSGDVQTALLQVSRGLEGLANNVSNFYQGFYSEQERMETLQRQVREALGGLDLSIDPALGDVAKAQFRQAVEAAFAAGNGELAAQLLATGQGFATAADYAQKSIDQLADAQAKAQEQLAAFRAQLRSDLIDLEGRFSSGGFARQYRAQDLASQVQGLFAGVGIDKDAGFLAEQILAATSAEVEDYFRSMWGMLDSDEARLQLIGVSDALLGLAQASAAAAADTERAALEQRWLQATGNTAELRRRELEALDPSNRALLQMIYGLEDAKTSFADLSNSANQAAQKAAQAWQGWGTAAGLGATHLGDTSGLEARQAILSAQLASSTDPAERLAKLQELISVEQSIAQAQQAGRKTELDAIKTRQDALRQELSAAQQLLSASQSLAEYVRKLYAGVESGLTDHDRLAALSGQYGALLGQAQAGDADAMQLLQGVSGDYLGLARELAVSNTDYAVLSGRIAAEMQAVATVGQASASSAMQQYQEQINALTAQTDLLSAAVELSDGTKALIARSMLEQADAWVRENTQALTLQELQQRAVDSLALMPAGIASAIRPTIEGSATYLANSLGGTMSGALSSLAAMLGMDGSHANGLSYVPFDGYRAELHRGERVLTAEENRIFSVPQAFVMQGASQSNAELIAAVHALRAEVAALKRPMEQTAAATTQQAEQFDNVTAGGNAMATEVM